ncbi:mRNA-capping enzyme subunit beta [Mortierella antarctica]|nr:mRNA-capping enzyme subunit beta [Mortierella antarctica]
MSEQDTRKRPLEGQAGQADETQPPVSAAAGTDSPSSKKPRLENQDSDISNPAPREGAMAQVRESESTSQEAPPNGVRPSVESRPQQRPPQQHQQLQRPPTRKDHAFFGTDVLDDVVRTIGDFLYEHCNNAHVEIEAKLGVLIDKSTGRRIQMPVRNEVVLSSQGRSSNWYRFSSDMTLEQHAHFNTILNNRLVQLQRIEPKERHERYEHTYEIDQFFASSQGKTRVTKDQKTNQVVPNGIVQKGRIADIDVFSPRNPFDFRVSVNIEVPVPLPQGVPQFERRKDRVSYRHNNFKIDLTQVKTANAPNANQHAHNFSQMRPQPNSNALDVTHELEVEFVNPGELVREREIRISSGGKQPDRFMEIVGHFINNVRGLMVRGNIQQHQPQPHQQQHHPSPYSQQRPH